MEGGGRGREKKDKSTKEWPSHRVGTYEYSNQKEGKGRVESMEIRKVTGREKRTRREARRQTNRKLCWIRREGGNLVCFGSMNGSRDMKSEGKIGGKWGNATGKPESIGEAVLRGTISLRSDKGVVERGGGKKPLGKVSGTPGEIATSTEGRLMKETEREELGGGAKG